MLAPQVRAAVVAGMRDVMPAKTKVFAGPPAEAQGARSAWVQDAKTRFESRAFGAGARFAVEHVAVTVRLEAYREAGRQTQAQAGALAAADEMAGLLQGWVWDHPDLGGLVDAAEIGECDSAVDATEQGWCGWWTVEVVCTIHPNGT